jgi:adenosylhomocysteinase
MPMNDAAPIGDIFVSATGDIHVFDEHHFMVMKDGALLSNSGHFDVEINKPALRELAVGDPKRARPFVEQFVMKHNGHRLNLLGAVDQSGGGRGASGVGHGHSFAGQASPPSTWWITRTSWESRLYHSDEVDQDRRISSMRYIKIDTLTQEQTKYLDCGRRPEIVTGYE